MSREGHPGAGSFPSAGGHHRPHSSTAEVAYQNNNNYVPSQDYRGQNKTVRYPPSMGGNYPYNHEGYGSRPMNHSVEGVVSGGSHGDSYRRVSSTTTYTVNDIIRQLEIATNENDRLKRTIVENNEFFERRCAEMQGSSSGPSRDELEKENMALKQQVTESTNRFCEARVAVLGFKCKVIQLTGELEKARASAGGGGGGGGGVVGGGSGVDEALRAEHQQLQVSMQQLKEKLSVCEKDKKEFASQSHRAKQDLANVEAQTRNLEEEVARLSQDVNQLHYQLQEKDTHIQQLNAFINKSQYSGDQQNQHEHTLRGQVEELLMKNRALESSVSNMKASNDDLIARNKKLEQNRDVMMEKLHRSADAATSPPVPKPRTTISGSDRERLEREIEGLKEQVQLLEKSRGTLDGMFQDANRKSQTLKEEVVQKELEVAAIRRELNGMQHQLEMNQQEKTQREDRMETLRRDLEKVQRDMRSLEREKQESVQQATMKEQDLRESVKDVEELRRARDEAREQVRRYRSQVSELEGRMSGSVDASKSRSKPGMSVAHRLNDALGNIKKLEEDKYNLEESLAIEKEERVRETRKLKARLELVEKDLNTEREQVRRAAEEEVVRLQQDNDQLREKEHYMSQQLMELESSKSSSLDSLRTELQEAQAVREQEKLLLTQQLEDKQTQLQRKETELEEVKAQLSKRDRKADKLESLQTSYSDLKTRCQELDTSAKDKETQVERLMRENEQCKNACEEYRKESESILQDYNTCAQRLKLAQDESSRWMREYTHQQDRVGLLEKNRNELEEKLCHMDHQIKIFQEDYAREKEAREAAVKVKNLAEERMKRMKEDLDDCRSKINDQAAKMAPHEDPRMDPRIDPRMDPYYSGNQPGGPGDRSRDRPFDHLGRTSDYPGRFPDQPTSNYPPTSTGHAPSRVGQHQDSSYVHQFPPSGGKYSQQPGGWTQITTPSAGNYRQPQPQRPMTSITGRPPMDLRPSGDYNSSSGSSGTFGTGTGVGGMGTSSGYNTGPPRAGGGRMGMSADGMDIGSNRVGSNTGALRAQGGGVGRMAMSADGIDAGSSRVGSNTSNIGDSRVGTGMGPGGRVGSGTGALPPRMGPGPGLGGGGGESSLRRSREHIQQTSDRMDTKEGELPTKPYRATNEDKTAPPLTPCPMCGRKDFKSQYDLEYHSANCSGLN